MSGDPLMDSLQMEGEPAVEQARKAIRHTLNVIHENKNVGYHMGLGTQAYSLLTEAFATATGTEVAVIRKSFLPPEPEVPPDTVLINRIRTAFEDWEVHLRRGHIVAANNARFVEAVKQLLKPS